MKSGSYSSAILGLRVDNLSVSEAVSQIVGHISSGRGLLRVITLNPEMVVRSQADWRFAQLLKSAGLVVPDGVGVVWGCDQLGSPVKERVPGIELTEKLLSAGEGLLGRPLTLFLLGAEDEVIAAAVDAVTHRFTGVEVVGAHHGFFPLEVSSEVVERINAVEPDVLLVGMGSPRQEQWVAEHAKELKVKVAIGVGGTFDVFAGRSRRAPVLVRRMGLEWLYRLALQPSRLPRMMSLPKFALLVLKEKFMRRG